MTERNRRQPDRDIPTYSPQTGSFDNDPAEESMWSEEELERAQMGWRAEDDPEEPNVPSNAPDIQDAYIELDPETVEDRLDEAADAIDEMAARERRRDQSYRTSGDDLNPGIDHAIDTNAPKDADRPTKKSGGSRGQSDGN